MKIIDTRDLLKRKEELEEFKSILEAAEEALIQHAENEPEEDESNTKSEFEAIEKELESSLKSATEDFGAAEEKELEEIEELENEISEFRHGATMIPERDFEEYARELAEELEAIPSDAQWPCTCIDWAQAASELEQNYSNVSFQGEYYLVRG